MSPKAIRTINHLAPASEQRVCLRCAHGEKIATHELIRCLYWEDKPLPVNPQGTCDEWEDRNQ